MLMPGGTDTDAALAANVIVRASFDNVIPGNVHPQWRMWKNAHLIKTLNFFLKQTKKLYCLKTQIYTFE